MIKVDMASLWGNQTEEIVKGISEATKNIIEYRNAPNTSKDMLLKLLNLGCKIRYHINDDRSKLETRFYAFESDNSNSFVYLTGAKLSEGGLTENISLITEIKYNLT